MSEDQTNPAAPTRRQLRDARRQAHEAQQKSTSDKGSDKKGKKGKGDRKP